MPGRRAIDRIENKDFKKMRYEYSCDPHIFVSCKYKGHKTYRKPIKRSTTDHILPSLSSETSLLYYFSEK
jgi:hypothetical protein